MQNNIPTAHIFAGANASGKSTFITHLISVGLINNENYICPDLILREDLKLEETLENYIQAAEIAKERTQQSISQKKDIVIETVFSTQQKVELIEQLKSSGYDTIVYFTGVESSDINVLYLKNRVEQGGHDVPIKKLLSRREAGLENIKKALGSIDCLVFIDNSLMYKAPVIVKSIYQNQICFINNNLDRNISWVDKLTQSINQINENDVPQKHLDFCNSITNSLSDFSKTLNKNYNEKNNILKTKEKQQSQGMER